MKHLFLTTALSCCLLTGPVWAEATESGAEALKAVLQTYLGSAEAALTIAVDGDAYAVSVDLAAMVPPAALQGGQLALTPLEFSLTDNGDGTWDYAQDQALAFNLVLPGALNMDVQIASFVSAGIFDESLMSFAETTTTLAGLTMTQVQTDPNIGEMRVDYAVDAINTASQAVAGAAGGVDSTMTYEITGISETITMPATEGSPPMEIVVDLESGSSDGTVTGLRPAAVYGLIAWVVAHPSEAAMTADRAGVKTILQDGIPFFDHMLVQALYQNITVTTPFGAGGLSEAEATIEARGVVSDGMLREAFRLKGLILPEGLVPPFAASLIPDEFSIDVAVSEFDLAAAFAHGLNLLDMQMGESVPEGFDAQLLALLMPKGAVQITMAPGSLHNEIYALDYKGQMSAGLAGVPTGTAKISLTGVEAILAALEQFPDEMKSQAVPVLGMAQAMAQPGPEGDLVWEIDASQPGSLKINGTEMMVPAQ